MLTPGEDQRELKEQRPRGELLAISKYIKCQGAEVETQLFSIGTKAGKISTNSRRRRKLKKRYRTLFNYRRGWEIVFI